MADTSRYSTTADQGMVALEQAADRWRALVGIRATLRRMVLAQRATAIKQSAPQKTWAEAVDQALIDIGLLVLKTPQALDDDPVIDPYPNL